MEAPLARRGTVMNVRVLEDDVRALSLAYEVALDDEYQHLFVMDFNTPPGYNFSSIPVLLEIPEYYPESPPGIGDSHVYLPRGLRYQGSKPKDYQERVGPSRNWLGGVMSPSNGTRAKTT